VATIVDSSNGFSQAKHWDRVFLFDLALVINGILSFGICVKKANRIRTIINEKKLSAGQNYIKIKRCLKKKRLIVIGPNGSANFKNSKQLFEYPHFL
jgi:hypothetical protein